jgi:peptide/nickel transport system ATP-binding protein
MTTSSAGAKLLSVRDLGVEFSTPQGPVTAVDGVSFDLEQGQRLGIVGESGSGKSVLVRTVMGLTKTNNARISGAVMLAGSPILSLRERRRRALWGRQVAMVFQDPLAGLHPLTPIGDQLVEALRRDPSLTRRDARRRAIELLELVGIPAAATRFHARANELSGGMRQRVMIAMAMAGQPRLLIADEPTTALDVTVQARILELFDRLCRQFGIGLILVSHDLRVIAAHTDDVAVMNAGRITETGPVGTVLTEPQVRYTGALIEAIHSGNGARSDNRAQLSARSATPTGQRPNAARKPGVTYPQSPVLGLRRATVTHRSRREGAIELITDVTLVLRPGEIVGLVGESGSGKSTTARALLGLVPLSAGTVELHGAPLGSRIGELRAAAQAIFQNPMLSFNPRRSLLNSVAEPLRVRGVGDPASRRRQALTELERVGLNEQVARQLPHLVSGGQCQRAAIARATILRPEVLICDEPVSSLDVSIQAQILELLADLRNDFGLAILFISHDLSVVAALCDRTSVMYAGCVVEQGETGEIADHPGHPYTVALHDSASAPIATATSAIRVHRRDIGDGRDGRLLGGCRYALSCDRVGARCDERRPESVEIAPAHTVSCYHPIGSELTHRAAEPAQ